MTGIEYPTITVGAHENLVVRMSLAAELLMIRRGLDPGILIRQVSPMSQGPPKEDKTVDLIPNPNWAQNMVTAFSCMVGENFLDPQSTRIDLNAVPTADYWATQIDDLTDVSKAVIASVGKAMQERRKKLAAVPATAAAS